MNPEVVLNTLRARLQNQRQEIQARTNELATQRLQDEADRQAVEVLFRRKFISEMVRLKVNTILDIMQDSLGLELVSDTALDKISVVQKGELVDEPFAIATWSLYKREDRTLRQPKTLQLVVDGNKTRFTMYIGNKPNTEITEEIVNDNERLTELLWEQYTASFVYAPAEKADLSED